MVHSAKKFNDKDMNCIDNIFNIVAKSLVALAKRTRLTYNEINIIVYYFLIPLSWCILIDIIIKIPIFSILWGLLWIILFAIHYKSFKSWCDRLFELSVKFLLGFRVIGWNYYKASVIICVILPLLIYGLLIWKNIK